MRAAVFALQVVFFTIPTSAAAPPASQPSGGPQVVARRFADDLAAGRFEQAAGAFNEKVRGALGPDQLEATWKKLGEQCGAFTGFGKPRQELQGTETTLIFPARWKNVTLDMRVTVDLTGQISGLWFRPQTATEEYKAPKYVDKAKFTEEDVKVGVEPWVLAGKLTLPRGATKCAGVVLVHGSGPNDLDETIGSNRPFRDLAWGLASRGVAVLRYDKRTNTYPAQMSGKDVGVRKEVLDDALAAVKLLRGRAEVDPKRVYVLGHSLGGCLAPSIGAEDATLAGLIVLSGTLRPMEEVILDQLEHLATLPGPEGEANKKVLGEVRIAIDQFRAGKLDSSALILGAPVGYWNDLNGHLGSAGEALARKFAGPMLVLSGGRDYQVTRKDFDVWQRALAGKPNVTLRWLPKLNHLYARGIGMATPSEYVKRQRHVDEEVIAGIAAWIETGRFPDSATSEPAKEP